MKERIKQNPKEKNNFKERLKSIPGKEKKLFYEELNKAPQARAERFGCIMWIIIFAAIILFFLLR